MAEEVGALRVSLSADTAQFERDMGKAAAAATRLGTLIGSRLGIAIGGAVGGFLAVSNAIDTFNTGIAEASKISELAERIGLTSRETQVFAEVARQAGVSLETMRQAADQLGQRLQAGLRSPTSDVSQIMRTLGVDVRNADGSLRTFGDMLPDLADGFARFADDQNKAAIAVRLFGQEAGPKMAQLLSQGSEAIRQQATELDRTTPKFDPEVIARFKKAQDDLAQTFKNLAIQFANFAAGPAADALNSFNRLIQATGTLVASLSQFRIGSAEELTAMREADRLLRERAKLQEELQALVEKRMTAALGSLERKELDALYFAGVDRLAKLRQEYDAFMATLGTRMANVAGKMGAGEGDGRPTIPLPDPKMLQELQAQLAATMAALGGQDPTKSLISQFLFGGQEPAVWTEAFGNAMAEIDRIGKLSGQTATQISNQKVALMQREQNLMQDTATLAASTLTTVFADNKAAAIAAAAINTAVGITRAMALPPPFNWIQAGLIAATGVAQMAAIRSSSLGSASTPSVNGGTGDEGRAEAAQTLMVQGINPGDWFSGEAVRDLAERLLQFQRDGGRVVLQ